MATMTIPEARHVAHSVQSVAHGALDRALAEWDAVGSAPKQLFVDGSWWPAASGC